MHTVSRWAASAVVLGSAIALTACTGGGAAPTDSAWAQVAPEDATGEIQVMAWAADQETVDEIADTFMEKYPNIDVTFKFTQYSDYGAALAASLASGEGPDAFIIEPLAKEQFAPFAEDLTPMFASQLGDDWQDQLNAAMTADLTTEDGRIVGAPLQANGNGMVLVNVGLLEEMGLSWPDDVTSIDDLVDFCADVNAAGKQCLGLGQDEWVMQDVMQAVANSVEPGSFTKAVRGEIPWTDPAIVEALNIFQRLYTDGVAQEGALAMPLYPDVDNEFQRGNLVAQATGNWSAMNFIAANSIAFQTGAGVTDPQPLKTALLPFPAVGGEDVHVFSSVYGGFAVNSSSKNKEAAAAWVNWYALDRTARSQTMSNDLIGISAISGVEVTPTDLAYPEVSEPSIQYLLEEFAASDDPRTIPYPDLITALGTALQQSASGTDSETVAADLEAASAAITR